MNIPDNYDMWLAHEAEQERLLERLPVCRRCGKRIQEEHYFYLEGRIYCEDCMNEKYRRHVEDYYD